MRELAPPTTHDDEGHTHALEGRLIRRLLGYLRPYRFDVVIAALVVLADTLAQLVGPYLTKEAIDNGIRHRDLDHLQQVTMLYLGILLISFGLAYLHTVIMQRVGQQLMLDLRLALFRHLQRLPVSFYDRNPVGRLMTRVTNDVDVLNELFSAGVVAIFGDLLLLVGIVIAMWQLNAELLGVAFSVLPLIAIATIALRSRVRRTFREIRSRMARLNASLNENLTGMSTVQLFGRERERFAEFRSINGAHRDANLRAVYYHSLFFPVLELVGALAVSLIVWYGGRQVMWTGITLGTLVAFIQYTQRFFRPIADLTEKYGILQQAMASSERIFTLLDTPADGDGVTHPRTAVDRLAGDIEFDHVTFGYRDGRPVLDDVSFRVRPGERVAIVGASGSGKTTLAHLLLGFYAPERGVIRLDGRPLDTLDPRSVRARIGLVQQDVVLFSGTIESNLAMGRAHLPAGAIERAARAVGAHDFIARLPGGYGQGVDERGASLSAGERQQIALARALAHDPDVLVLDEATSSIDPRTEAGIQEALRDSMAGRTCLVIAHRLSTIQDADRILVLHHGRLREQGTHAELMGLQGIYFRLHQLQALGGRRRPGRTPLGGAWNAVADVPVVDSPRDVA